MDFLKRPSRRKVLKTGLASLATAAVTTPMAKAAIPKKGRGETKIVAVMGDYWHPAIAQETHVRRIFSSLNSWKIYFVVASRFLTEELLSDADLLISARYGGSDSIAWSPDPVIVTRPKPDRIWSDEHVSAIIDNVRNRGMGWMACHCTLFNGRAKLEDFMGIKPILHQEVQPLGVRDLNQDHPITRGIESFFVNLDEQFDVEIQDPANTTILFKSLAIHDKRVATSGWCVERGKGRVVGLLPGHYQWPYRLPEYQEIFWRAAHWAMKRDIPPYPQR